VIKSNWKKQVKKMKKIFGMVLLFLFILLSGCSGLRERLLAPPDEMEIPKGSLMATCEKEDIVYKYVYQNDGVYLYYIDDELQNEEALDLIQEQAYLHMESVANYLDDEYGIGACTIEDYVDSDE
jgi:hypothetical protein